MKLENIMGLALMASCSTQEIDTGNLGYLPHYLEITPQPAKADDNLECSVIMLSYGSGFYNYLEIIGPGLFDYSWEVNGGSVFNEIDRTSRLDSSYTSRGDIVTCNAITTNGDDFDIPSEKIKIY
ncbi:MAG: hypothetical protein Q8Q35_00995 [Nanoarchaeota archaeon]|nr:hypothetical protein [Nanoarchaeota archaeon]